MAIGGLLFSAIVSFVLNQALNTFLYKKEDDPDLLEDVTRQTASYGKGIIRGWGTIPVSPNLLWNPRIRKKYTGAGVESWLDSHAGLVDGEIQGIGRVWFNGQLFVNFRNDATEEEKEAVTKFNRYMDIFYGTPNQSADNQVLTIKDSQYMGGVATLQDFPSYPGIAYLAIRNLPANGDILENAIPEMKVEVITKTSSVGNAGWEEVAPIWNVYMDTAGVGSRGGMDGAAISFAGSIYKYSHFVIADGGWDGLYRMGSARSTDGVSWRTWFIHRIGNNYEESPSLWRGGTEFGWEGVHIPFRDFNTMAYTIQDYSMLVYTPDDAVTTPSGYTDQIFIFGGVMNGSFVNYPSFARYTPDTGKFINGFSQEYGQNGLTRLIGDDDPTLRPFPRHQMAMVVFKEQNSLELKMYLVGGIRITDADSSVTTKYGDTWTSTNGKDWTKVTDDAGIGLQRTGAFLVEHKGDLFCIGGDHTAAGGSVTDPISADTSTNKFTITGGTGTFDFLVLGTGSYVQVSGYGDANDDTYKVTGIDSMPGSKWITVSPSIPVNRGSVAGVTIDAGKQVSNTVYKYSSNGIFSLITTNISDGVAGLTPLSDVQGIWAAVSWGNDIVAIVYDPNKGSDIAVISSTDGETWITHPTLNNFPADVYELGNYPGFSFTVHGNRLYLIGGLNPDGTTNEFRVMRTGNIESSPTTVALASVVIDLLVTRGGMDASLIDVTDIISIEVDGYGIGNVNGRSALEPLMRTYNIDVVETDKLYFRQRVNAETNVTITQSDVGASVDRSIKDWFQYTRQQDLEIPSQINLSFLDKNSDYNVSTEVAILPKELANGTRVIGNNNVGNIDLSVVMDSDRAKSLAESLLATVQMERVSINIDVGIEYIYLEPGDVFTLSIDAGTFSLRIVEIVLVGKNALTLTCVSEFLGASDYPDDIGVIGEGVGIDPVKNVYPISELLDIPFLPLENSNDDYGFWVASGVESEQLEYWTDSHLYKQNKTGEEVFEIVGDAITNINTIGYVNDVSSIRTDASIYVWDNNSTFDVVIQTGENNLSSSPPQKVFSGDNLFLVGDEIVSACTVSYLGYLTATNSELNYRISGLLRGRLGTENEMSTHSNNERFVLLKNMKKIANDVGQSSIANSYKVVAAGSSTGETNAESFTNNCISKRPPTPCHIKGYRFSSGTWKISGIRKTRYNGEWMGNLGILESQPNFIKLKIDFYDSTFTTLLKSDKIKIFVPDSYRRGTGEFFYTLPHLTQSHIWGYIQSALYVEITQISDDYPINDGKGIAARATLTIK